MPRVLMVAYGYPPRVGSGVQRTVKFVRYLGEFGWIPTVLTARWSAAGERRGDDSLNRQVDGVETAYTGEPVPKSAFWQFLSQSPGGWRWVPTLRDNVSSPDRVGAWKGDVVKAGSRLLTDGGFDALYTTSPPVAAHVAGARLKRRFRIPWVADFRDPWTDNRIAYRRTWGIRKRLDRRLERRIYRLADMIVANTEMNRRTLIHGHQVGPEKVVTVPNGYDEADFDGVVGERPRDFFRVTYCGAAYASYHPGAFGEVLRRFVDGAPRARIRWTIAGGACEWACRSQQEVELDGRIELLGHLPHERVPSLLLSSNLLVHVYPRNLEYSVPGKLYEYLRSGTPVLAICDRPSEVERILRETAGGRAFAHDEIDAAVAWLADRYRQWEFGQGNYATARGPNQAVGAYERRELTRRLAEVLNAVARPTDKSFYGSGEARSSVSA